MRTVLRNFSEWTFDRIWPHSTGEADKEPRANKYFNPSEPNHVNLVQAIEDSAVPLLAQSEERFRTVERKLVAILTLTVVLSAIVTATILVVPTLGLGSVSSAIPAWCITILALAVATLIFYIVVQLVCAIYSAVGGLIRTGYKTLTPEGILPEDAENREEYRLRVLNTQINNMRWNDWEMDKKVTCMAVAHVAMRNALLAALLLVGIVFAVAALQLLGIFN